MVMPVDRATTGAADGTEPKASASVELPQVFGRYLLVRRLSRGGMGEIFLAKCGQLTGFEKLCVIKKILPNLAADREFIRRFIDEAQVAIKLSHANIAPVFEVGMVEGEYFLALEYLEGRDVRRIQARLGDERRRLPLDLALWIGREIAGGLAYAHRRADDDGKPLSLVHCDVSPPNVIVSFEGEVKIIDFGIAKSAVRISETNPKVGFGKFGYMAPEQLLRGGVVDRRTDVYATGVLLYELMTGERLFQFPEGADYREMARMVTRGQHPKPSDRDPALQPLDAVVLKAVAPAPDDRFANAEELRDAIQMALVRVNPTLTSDRLGAFLRGLFHDELAEEAALLRQVKGTDLSEFADELTGARTHTVSFALHQDVTGGSQIGEVTGQGAPHDTIQTQLVGRASGEHPAARRRWWPIAAALGALCLVAGAGIGFGLTRGGKRTAPGAPRAQTPVIVQSIPPMPMPAPQPTVTPVPDPAVEIEPIRESSRPPPAAARPPSRASRSKPAKPDSEPLAAPTASDVQAKVKAVAREYAAFKKSYGQRLDAEWNEILSQATFTSGEDKNRKLDARLDSFRKRMADVKREN